MKRFFRSIAGKTLLFIMINLLAAAAVVSIAGFLSVGETVRINDVSYEISRPELWLTALILCMILLIICFIVLMCVSGKRPDTDEAVPGPLAAVPFDLLAVLSIFLSYCLLRASDTYLTFSGFRSSEFIVNCGLLVIFLNLFLGLCMSAASRIKQRVLIKGSLIYKLLNVLLRFLKWLLKGLAKLGKLVISGFRSIPLVWKTLLALLLFSLPVVALTCSSSGYYSNNLRTVVFLELLLLIPFILYVAFCLKKLKAGGEALASGDLQHQTATRSMIWDLKKHGENLNSIADGMAKAVEEQLKSERMKTELITNVSHDIKTPLTSIINYSSLIANEPCVNANVKEYSAVLLRQSERLKRLIEDLVEASKASTGNLEVFLSPCDASVFLQQAAGEYEERLSKAGLTLVENHPEEELRILADGRRMQRIFDNLMNNILKYAQPGTRVYLSLEKIGHQAVMTFKNTSKEALNISADELMERFTRGDASRYTEGNGLGLSIAKSLAELQNGSLQVFIDGDLFKALLAFPLIG